MGKQPILLIGAGGHSRACIDVIERLGTFQIAGLVSSAAEEGSEQLGYPILGTDSDLPTLRKHCSHALVAVGQIRSPALRKRLFVQALSLGFILPTLVSTRAHVSRHAKVGVGTVVMHGAVVNAGAEIGANCIINSLALVEHDARVDDHCHISTGAILNGGVHVGSGTFIGSGSTVQEGLRIGSSCIVGMGQSVSLPLANGMQQPAKKVKT